MVDRPDAFVIHDLTRGREGLADWDAAMTDIRAQFGPPPQVRSFAGT